MSDAWIVAIPSVALVLVCLVGLVTIPPYLDGRQRRLRDKWIRANTISWACYKRGKHDDIRHTRKVLGRYENRRGQA